MKRINYSALVGGLPAVVVSMVLLLTENYQTPKVEMDPNRLLPAVRENQLSLKEFLTVQALHRRFLSSPRPFVLNIGFIAHGESPSEGT